MRPGANATTRARPTASRPSREAERTFIVALLRVNHQRPTEDRRRHLATEGTVVGVVGDRWSEKTGSSSRRNDGPSSAPTTDHEPPTTPRYFAGAGRPGAARNTAEGFP